LLKKLPFAKPYPSVFNNPFFNIPAFPTFQPNKRPFLSNPEMGVCFLWKTFLITFSNPFINIFNRLRNTGKDFFKF